MDAIKTETLLPNEAGCQRAVEIWHAGGLVAFPTETVYGLGADATNDAAVRRIFAAKGRPVFNPLILHVADLAMAEQYAHFSDQALALAETFWPGPLSLVLPLRVDSGLSPLVSAGLDSVALRVPETPLAGSLLRAFGGAIAAPSANPSGQISPTSAAHVLAGLGQRIDAVIDGGACTVGLESSIVQPDIPALLRPGGLPEAVIEAALGQPLQHPANGENPTAPGQMISHYAPRVPVDLDVSDPGDRAIWLGFGPDCAGAALNLSPGANLHEAAANLFEYLHRLDDMAQSGHVDSIAVAPIPQTGLGIAINDRLTRAAAPRS